MIVSYRHSSVCRMVSGDKSVLISLPIKAAFYDFT